jgi:hypothetical protein
MGKRFSAPDQTGPGANPASCTTGTGSFLGVRPPGHGVDHQPPSSGEVKEKAELYLYSPSGPTWLVLGWTFTSSWDSIVGRVIIPWTEWSGVQIPAVKRFAVFQKGQNGSGFYPASNLMGTGGYVPQRVYHTEHSPQLVQRLRISRAIPPIPLYTLICV